MVPMNFQQCWKAKLERPHFLKVRSDKKTVCEIIFGRDITTASLHSYFEQAYSDKGPSVSIQLINSFFIFNMYFKKSCVLLVLKYNICVFMVNIGFGGSYVLQLFFIKAKRAEFFFWILFFVHIFLFIFFSSSFSVTN